MIRRSENGIIAHKILPRLWSTSEKLHSWIRSEPMREDVIYVTMLIKSWSVIITMGSLWARWCLKSTATRLFVLLKRLFWRRSKKTSKLCVTGLCDGNPLQRASISIRWRYHMACYTDAHLCRATHKRRLRRVLSYVDRRIPRLYGAARSAPRWYVRSWQWRSRHIHRRYSHIVWKGRLSCY